MSLLFNTLSRFVLHYLQSLLKLFGHVHWDSDSIQPSHPLLSLLFMPSIFPSTSIFINELALCIRWPKFRASASVLPMNIQGCFHWGWIGLISFLPMDSQESSPTSQFKSISSSGLATRFIHDILQVSMPFSQIISLSPSPTWVQKTVLYICVSFAISLKGYCYHLSKFHICALVYCIGVFLSGLLQSV